MGEHGQGGPTMPRGPAPDLVLVEAGESFGGLEGFLDTPALTGHGDQRVQCGRPWCVAAQVGQLAGGIIAADQQMVLTGVGVGLRLPATASSRSCAAGRGGAQGTQTSLVDW